MNLQQQNKQVMLYKNNGKKTNIFKIFKTNYLRVEPIIEYNYYYNRSSGMRDIERLLNNINDN